MAETLSKSVHPRFFLSPRVPEEGKLQFYISQKIEFYVNNAVKKRKEFEETRHFPDSEVAQFIKFQKKI